MVQGLLGSRVQLYGLKSALNTPEEKYDLSEVHNPIIIIPTSK
jgi:hypothetical protein